MNEETNKAFIAYPGDCEVCYHCKNLCPKDAIMLSPELVREIVFPY
jgi:formate hydrogenlyase subunit 6/NADH:ubiquinone oxidoreductase subunit I